MQHILKLDFNERSDKNPSISKDYSFGDTLWQYPAREMLEEKIAQLNQLDNNQLLCTNGGDEAIMLLMRLIKENQQTSDDNSANQLILPLPAFSQYTWGIKSWNIETKLIPANNDLSFDTQNIINQLKSTTNSVAIITRPNNPTGELIKLAVLKAMLEAARKTQSWIFLDEAYIEFSPVQEQSESIRLLTQFDNLVILRTFSKAYGLAGIRLGYLLGNAKLINAFKTRCLPFNISEPTLQIANQALTDNNRNKVNQYCKQISANRDITIEWLQQNNIPVLASKANFVLLQLPKNQAKAIQSFLKKNNILVRTFIEPELVNCLRITIPYNLDKLLALLQQALVPGLVCLDMDGVLIDTSNSYDESVKATVKQLSGKTVTQSDIETLRKSGGYNNDWLLTQKLLKNRGHAISIEEVTRVFQLFYLGDKTIDGRQNGYVANEKPIINDALSSKVKQASRTKFAIVTGRPRKEASAGKKLIQLETLETVSLDDVIEGKPSPEGIEKLKQRYSTLSWMCGDNPDDMQAANRSNSLAIGIGKNNENTLYQAGADIVFETINDLEAWLCPIK